MNLLIPYVPLYNHPDPLFDEFTYGDVQGRARKLKNDVEKGDYLFFHTSTGGHKYITAYYVVDRVLDTCTAAMNPNIVTKYKNPHIREYLAGKSDRLNDVLLFGDPIESRILERPLLFNRSLAAELSLNIQFPAGKTETQVIGSATRSWRQLPDADVSNLLRLITETERSSLSADTVLSTDEVAEIIEKDLEKYIESNPGFIGRGFHVTGRQVITPVGRIDLLLEDTTETLVVVELKLNMIGRDAVSQLRRYMDWLKNESGKPVAGVIVCKGIMPAFADDLGQMKNIRILCYGWQLRVQPWTGERYPF